VESCSDTTGQAEAWCGSGEYSGEQLGWCGNSNQDQEPGIHGNRSPACVGIGTRLAWEKSQADVDGNQCDMATMQVKVVTDTRLVSDWSQAGMDI